MSTFPSSAPLPAARAAACALPHLDAAATRVALVRVSGLDPTGAVAARAASFVHDPASPARVITAASGTIFPLCPLGAATTATPHDSTAGTATAPTTGFTGRVYGPPTPQTHSSAVTAAVTASASTSTATEASVGAPPLSPLRSIVANAGFTLSPAGHGVVILCPGALIAPYLATTATRKNSAHAASSSNSGSATVVTSPLSRLARDPHGRAFAAASRCLRPPLAPGTTVDILVDIPHSHSAHSHALSYAEGTFAFAPPTLSEPALLDTADLPSHSSDPPCQSTSSAGAASARARWLPCSLLCVGTSAAAAAALNRLTSGIASGGLTSSAGGLHSTSGGDGLAEEVEALQQQQQYQHQQLQQQQLPLQQGQSISGTPSNNPSISTDKQHEAYLQRMLEQSQSANSSQNQSQSYNLGHSLGQSLGVSLGASASALSPPQRDTHADAHPCLSSDTGAVGVAAPLTAAAGTVRVSPAPGGGWPGGWTVGWPSQRIIDAVVNLQRPVAHSSPVQSTAADGGAEFTSLGPAPVEDAARWALLYCPYLTLAPLGAASAVLQRPVSAPAPDVHVRVQRLSRGARVVSLATPYGALSPLAFLGSAAAGAVGNLVAPALPVALRGYLDAKHAIAAPAQQQQQPAQYVQPQRPQKHSQPVAPKGSSTKTSVRRSSSSRSQGAAHSQSHSANQSDAPGLRHAHGQSRTYTPTFAASQSLQASQQ